MLEPRSATRGTCVAQQVAHGQHIVDGARAEAPSERPWPRES